jgi:hypothetical protein
MEYGQQLRYCRAKAYLHVIILFGLKKTFLFRWDASKPSGWTRFFFFSFMSGPHESKASHSFHTQLYSPVSNSSCDCVVCVLTWNSSCASRVSKDSISSSVQTKSFYFPRKKWNVNTFSDSRYVHLHDCSIDGLWF